MKMRMSTKKAKVFFDTARTAYADSTFIYDEHQLHYIKTGKKDKPTLFFVHGSPGSWDAYKDYLKDSLLLQKYRMIAIDRPGFGYSDFGKAEDLETQAAIILQFIKTIDNKRPIVLIGHSMGGPVIVKMAALNSNLFCHLVVLAGSVDPNAETPEIWRSVLQKKPIRYLIPGSLRPSNDELWWLKEDLIAMKSQLKNIKCQVIIIHGTKDQLVPYSNVAFMQREFINAKKIDTISIKEASHFIPWEHYDVIRDVLFKLEVRS
jgi:pimeloyl-ACP methyl ester carboxylesterase